MKKIGRRRRRTKHKGPCSIVVDAKTGARCGGRGRLMHHCRICEELHQAGKIPAPFAVQHCEAHSVEALAMMKRHVLVKHPVTIPRAFVAALKGEM